MKILVFSDLHIGAYQSFCTKEKVRDVIYREKPSHVIFAGDIIDLMLGEYLGDYISFTTSLKVPCTVLNGNHDNAFSRDQILFKLGEKRVRVLHGHQFDSFFTKILDPITVKINDFILILTGFNFQNFIRKALAKEYPEGFYVPKFYEQRKSILEKYKDDIIITGHTHYPEVTELPDGRIYANPGCWETYLVLEGEKVELRSF